MAAALVLPATAAFVMLAGCTPHDIPTSPDAGAEAGLAQALAGFVPGRTATCAANSYTRLPAVAYGRTLLYCDTRNIILRNDTAGGCPTAGHGDVTTLDQLRDRPCQGDILHTRNPISGRPTGSCTLGVFVTYTRPR